MLRLKYACHFQKPRLRARRLNPLPLAQVVSEKAINSNRWIADYSNGGSVANAYNFPAKTECAVAVSDPGGFVVLWCGRTRANKPTGRSICINTEDLTEAVDLFDARITDECRIAAAWEFLQRLHAEFWTPIEMIAHSKVINQTTED